MSEWGSLLLVFWLLWVVDGWKLPPVERFVVIGGARRARLHFARLLPPPWSPAGWSVVAADVPFSISPAGICNRPAGAAGRPVDAPTAATAWAWADVREATLADGWLLINGHRFCRNTGHIGARQLLELAQLADAARLPRLEWLLARWLRPAHLRRRRRVLRARTATAASLNTTFLALAAGITLYLVADVAHRLPARWSDFAGRLLPLLGGYLALLHVAAMVSAWLAVRRLKRVQPDRRGSALLTAALLPPQALRLRALAADGFFPAQHPLAYALAFAGPAQLRQVAFDTLADLRWPVRDERDHPAARAICAWHRVELARQLTPALAAAGIAEAELFRSPEPEGPASLRYCPRCRSQFTVARECCPDGVKLLPLERR
jgi:hypothetical protein